MLSGGVGAGQLRSGGVGRGRQLSDGVGSIQVGSTKGVKWKMISGNVKKQTKPGPITANKGCTVHGNFKREFPIIIIMII